MNPVAVVINGTRLTMAEIEAKSPAGLFQARNTFFDVQKKAIEEYVTDYIVEQQAKKEGLTVDQLLEKHVNSAAGTTPSDEALRAYYDGLDVQETFEAIKPKIIDTIKQRRIAKAKAAYLAQLKAASTVEIKMAQPRAQISLKDTPIKGNPNAPVMVVEFADYECPYCQQIEPALDKLAAGLSRQIAVAYKDIPLPMHANAQKASEAAHCAGNCRGSIGSITMSCIPASSWRCRNLKEAARALKLDGAAFDKCLDGNANAELVKTSLNEAQGLGIPGTPGFFVNGRFISGAASYDILKQLVEEELHSQPQVSPTAPMPEATNKSITRPHVPLQLELVLVS